MLGLGCQVRVLIFIVLIMIVIGFHPRNNFVEYVEAVLVQHYKLPIKLYYMKIPSWYLFDNERLSFSALAELIYIQFGLRFHTY